MRALLLLLCACGGYANVLPDLNPPPGRDVKRIQWVDGLLRPHWEATRWHRPQDPVMDVMIYFVVAQDGSACIVPSDIWAVAKQGDAIRCQGKWRFPR